MSLINIEIATNALGLEKPAHALVKGIVRGTMRAHGVNEPWVTPIAERRPMSETIIYEAHVKGLTMR